MQDQGTRLARLTNEIAAMRKDLRDHNKAAKDAIKELEATQEQLAKDIAAGIVENV